MLFRTWHTYSSMPTDSSLISQPIELGPGPGTELKHMLAWFDDDEKAAAINAWGVQGSLFHIDTIIDWIIAVAAKHALPSEQITRPLATAMVQTAINRFFKKFPDGVSTDEDD
jgi:hypothetical protein